MHIWCKHLVSQPYRVFQSPPLDIGDKIPLSKSSVFVGNKKVS